MEEFFHELGRAVAGLGVDEEERVRVLVTSHGGFIREMNQLLVRRYECAMPCQVNSVEVSVVNPELFFPDPDSATNFQKFRNQTVPDAIGSDPSHFNIETKI